jgi:hypothetical protein
LAEHVHPDLRHDSAHPRKTPAAPAAPVPGTGCRQLALWDGGRPRAGREAERGPTGWAREARDAV